MSRYPVRSFNYSFWAQGLPQFALDFHCHDARRVLSEVFELSPDLVNVKPSIARRPADDFQLTAVTGAGKTDPGESTIVACRYVVPRLRAVRKLVGRQSPCPEGVSERGWLWSIAEGSTPCESGSLEHYYFLTLLGIEGTWTEEHRPSAQRAAQALVFKSCTVVAPQHKKR